MLATTSVLVKTEDGREALAARRHDMQVRQRHLLILIDGARTVGQLHQLLSDWPDLDDLLAGLQQTGMVDVLSRDLPADSQAPTSTDAFDPIAHFNRPLFGDGADRRAVSAIYDGLPPLGGMTLGLQTVAAPADAPASNEDQLAPPTRVPAMRPPVDCELADVLPDVTKVELMRLALQHFGPAAAAAMPLLRACPEDSQSLCDVIATCAEAAEPAAGERAAARFVDAAMQVMAHRR
jgi:hypothetical protein